MKLFPAFLLLSLTASAQTSPTVLPLGDSITLGTDYATSSQGGYRDPLYSALTTAGVAFTYVGARTDNATVALSSAGETAHDGFGGWHISDLDANLDGVANPIGGGDNNMGGYLLTGGHGTGRSALAPGYVLVHAGTNDILQGVSGINAEMLSLVQHLHALAPSAIVLVAGIIPMNYPSFLPQIQAFNAYIKTTLVPSYPYLRFVDQYTPFLNSDGSVNAALLGTDNVHPNATGYRSMGATWASALQSAMNATPTPTPVLTTYPLLITGGTGSGNYPAGTVVTIQPAPVTYLTQAATTDILVQTTLTQALPSPTPTPTTLGVFNLLSNSAATGNALNVAYGQSSEGGSLITYWQGQPGFTVTTVTGGYTIAETIGGRCLTITGSAVTISSCTGTANQAFSLTKQTDGAYLVSTGTQCMTTAGSFQPVTAAPCKAGPAMEWTFSGPQPLP